MRRSQGGVTKTWQIAEHELDDSLNENVGLYRELCDHRNGNSNEDGKVEEEAIRYLLYLDSERSSLFLANHVMICEGASEKALMDRLVDAEWCDLKKAQVYFLDAMGKYNFHRFMKLFERLGIPHSLLYDTDKDSGDHQVVNQFILKSKTPLTIGVSNFDSDLENFLGIQRPKRNDMKPINVIRAYENGCIKKDKLKELRAEVDGILSLNVSA